uniref:RS10B protein n=1 Tax=Serinus canaria TaxID=9135 RepID=A0A8C9N612_SERCA
MFNLHLADKAKEDEDEQKVLFHSWMCQVEVFLTKKLFPAFEHEIVLRDKIKEIKPQDAELAELRKIQAEELERSLQLKKEASKRESSPTKRGSQGSEPKEEKAEKTAPRGTKATADKKKKK